MKTIPRRATLIGCAVAMLATPAGLAAQGYTAEVAVNGTFVELRGLARDSLPESEVPGEGLSRELADGTIVRCIPDEFCRWFPSGDVEEVSLVTEDVRISAWPGIQGLAAHVHVRGRYGSDDFWPRSDQELEAVYAYLSYQRDDWRVRAGRQHRVNGLGYYNFDGASVRWTGFDPVRIDVYGGWSLARNLNAPRTGSLLEDADRFAPDDRGYIVGVDVGARWGRVADGSFTYQREIRTDELALYTERVAGDLGLRLDRFSLDFSADYDLGYEEFNEARIRLSAPIAAGFEGMVEARHYTPHFELWTIWGAFSPVSFDETRAWVAWTSPGGDLRLEGGGAWRTYEDADAGATFVGLEDDGWRGFGRVYAKRGGWFVDGAYRAEEGSGAAHYGGDLFLGYDFGPGRFVSLRGTSSQSFSEFRVGEQVTAGGGISAGWRFGDVWVNGAWAVYDITYEDKPAVEDWTQSRGHLGVSYRFGTMPGQGERLKGGYR